MKNRLPSFRLYIQVGLLLLAVIALYAAPLSAPFVFDDLGLFDNTEALSKVEFPILKIGLARGCGAKLI